MSSVTSVAMSAKGAVKTLSRTAKAPGVAVCFLLAGGSAAAVHAETARNETADSGKLEEIVVTAQFRAQNLQETPLAITAVTSDMMEARSQSTLMSVAQQAPSVTFASASNGLGGSQSANVSIRGIGQNDFNLAMEPGVGTYIDDVYYGTLYGSTLSLLDLDRVEILRGPQGTLSGKNSEGGSVKLFSKAPSAERNAYIEATYGSYDRLRLRAGSNFTLAPDTLFLRLTGMSERETGYVKRYDYQCVNGAVPGLPASTIAGLGSDCVVGHEGGTDVIALRGALKYVASANIEDTLTVDITRDRSDPTASVLLKQGVPDGFGPWATPGTLAPAPDFTFPAGSYKSYASYCGLVGTPNVYCTDPTSRLDAWGASNVLDAKLTDTLQLKSITAVRKTDLNSAVQLGSAPFSPILNIVGIDYKQYTQELRLSGSVGSLVDWTVGGFYFRSDAVQDLRVNLDGGVTNWGSTVDFLSLNNVKVTSKSVFAHVEVKPTDALTLTGGLRYTDDKKDFDYHYGTAPGYTPSLATSFFLATDGQARTFKGSRLDYRATASYKITPDVNVYVQTATGFKGGGTNPRPFSLLELSNFKPETVTSYEAGVKTFFFDRRVRLNADVYINKVKDLQLLLLNCGYLYGVPFSPCALPANVGNATVKGVEVEADVRATNALSFDLSASYLDFKYEDVDPITGVTDDMSPPFTPKWKASAGLQYVFDVGQSGSLTPRIDYQYTSSQAGFSVNKPGNHIDSVGLANARLTYKSLADDWQVALEVTNAFNKYYFVGKNAEYNQWNGLPGAPRKWAISFKRTF